MPATGLTPRRIQTAKPKRAHYVIRDRKIKGLGLLVAPTGRKIYQLDKTIRGERHKETIGDTDAITLKEAREKADRRIGEITELHFVGPATPFEVMAELALRRRARLWKPGTLVGRRSYVRTRLLPYFEGRSIASITRRDIEDWFAEQRSKPGGANLCAHLLSVIMREAEDMGTRPEGSNPVRGLRLYRRPKKDRVLTPDEMASLGALLKAKAESHPLHTAVMRLLVLTGCRVGEIQSLHWRDYRHGHLHLPDSKTGPKTVFLSSHARSVLDGVATPRNGLVFPSRTRKGRHLNVTGFWLQLRKEAGIADVRLHDLRHTYASVAVRSGESLPVVGTLLGHTHPNTTAKYTHLDDRTMREAVEVVGKAMAGRKGDGQ